MVLFLVGLLILVVGYFTYGKFVEKVFGPDDRETPALLLTDGVDYVPMPQWKNMLIQLLNIAGIGPVIGVIIGIRFGEIVFLLLPIGNIIGGAVHDMASGMMSLRNNGANLPQLITKYCGKWFGSIFSVFMVVCLLLVVAVFINVPANLLDGVAVQTMQAEAGSQPIFWYAVAAIFLYYIIATMFPVDKIIGKCYPIFGALLLIGTLAIFAKLIIDCASDPSLLDEGTAFKAGMFKAPKMPIIPMMFITIACGIISGFHATQSPIIARTMRSERQARASFYGMMVLEGFIGMVWAGAALAIYNIAPETLKLPAPVTLGHITTHFLGDWIGGITLFSVVILAITSGDTALRSVRLSLAETFKLNQKPLVKRFAVCVPLIVIISLLLWWSNASSESFNMLWHYFAWANQVIAVCTLFAATVYLTSLKRLSIITLLPGMFMFFITFAYLISSKQLGAPLGAPLGLSLPLWLSQVIAAVVSLGVGGLMVYKGRKLSKQNEA